MRPKLLDMKETKYYHDILNKCQWYKVKGLDNWYTVSYNGIEFAEMFHGKSGRWFGVIYEVGTVKGTDLRLVEMIIASRVLNPLS